MRRDVGHVGLEGIETASIHSLVGRENAHVEVLLLGGLNLLLLLLQQLDLLLDSKLLHYNTRTRISTLWPRGYA